MHLRVQPIVLSDEDCMVLVLGTPFEKECCIRAMQGCFTLQVRLPLADLQPEKTDLTRACLQAVPTCVSQSYARHLRGLSEAALPDPPQIYHQH